MPRLLMLLVALFFVTQAEAGLMRWSVVYLDGNGKPVNYGKHKNAEAWSENQRGFQIGIGCAYGGELSLHLKAPDDEKGDFAGDAFEPSVRVHKPGTDIFLGPTGKMTFDGERYNGPLPTVVMDAILTKEKNLTIAVADFNSRQTIIMPLQRVDRVMGELPCLK